MRTIDHWLPLLLSPGSARPLRWDGHVLTDEAGCRYPVVDGIARLLPAGALGADDARYQRLARLYDRLAPLYAVNERIRTRPLLGVDAGRAAADDRWSAEPRTGVPRQGGHECPPGDSD